MKANENPLAVAASVRGETRRAREGQMSAAERGAYVERLKALVEHPSDRVKQAVAEALPHVPDGVYARHVRMHARTNLGAAEPVFERTALLPIVLGEIEALKTLFADRAGRIRVELSVDSGLELEVDARFLRQALANLLKNAVEAYDV